MSIVRRFTLGYRFVKKKKRFAAICKDMDFYWEMHQKHDFDHIISRESTAEEKDAWKNFIYGQDNHGHPVLYDLVGSSDLELMKREFMRKGEPFGDNALRHGFHFMRRVENIKMQASQRYGVQIYRHVQIMDMGEFTADHLRGKNKKLTKLVVNSMSRMFPEYTHRMYIINAPWPFRAAWGIIKNFMDPVTVSKTKVLSLFLALSLSFSLSVHVGALCICTCADR